MAWLCLLAGALVMFAAGYDFKARKDTEILIREARFRGDAVLAIAQIASIKGKADVALHGQLDRIIGTLKKYV